MYCSCIDQGLQNSGKLDNLENSRWLADEMLGEFYNDNIQLRKILDSLAKEIIVLDKGMQFNTKRYETAFGKVFYKVSCLQFYESKKMDSIAKSFDRILSNNK
jgi:hypothetical protein